MGNLFYLVCVRACIQNVKRSDYRVVQVFAHSFLIKELCTRSVSVQ